MRGLVFSIDDAYVMPFKVLWHSLIKTESIPENTPVFILHEETLTSDSIQDLNNLIDRDGFSVSFINPGTNIPNDLPVSHHVSKATYYRLFVSSILPSHISSVVYLDSDMIAVSSIRQLFEIKLNKPIAAVDHFSPKDAIRIWGDYSGEYFQAGVLIMDINHMRRSSAEEHFSRIIKNESSRIMWWDQDVLNIAFENQWQKLPIWFNVAQCARAQIDEWIKDRFDQVCLLHYDGGLKPWKKHNIGEYEKIWYDGYSQAYGYNFKKEKKNNYLINKILELFIK